MPFRNMPIRRKLMFQLHAHQQRGRTAHVRRIRRERVLTFKDKAFRG